MAREKTVYMCFSTDVIHSGHIEIIRRAEKLGKLVIGVMSDEAVASYKRFPLLTIALKSFSGTGKVELTFI